jgi:hypothetical protein
MAKWSRERIIREILRRESSGLSLDLGATDRVESSLYQAAQRVFGSWRNAVMAAGISPNKARVHDPWPPSKILASIRSLARRTRPLRPAEVKRRYEPLVTAARRHFGSWPKAIVAAGVDPEKLRRVTRWTKQRIIEAILTRALRGKRLNSSAVRPQSLVEAGARVFGSWESALEAAGIDPRQASRRHRAGALGAAVGSTDDDEQARPNDIASSVSCHRRRPPYTRWSDEEILLGIRTRVRENKKMNAAAVDEDDGPLYRAAKRRYGSWRSALVAAGLDPDRLRVRLATNPV